MNSKRKGKAGELEACRELERVFGCQARRGQQFQGTPESPDVIAIDGLHIEVKRVEKLNLENAMAQAIADAGESVPVVLHRKNRGKWLLTCELDRVPGLLEVLGQIPKGA